MNATEEAPKRGNGRNLEMRSLNGLTGLCLLFVGKER